MTAALQLHQNDWPVSGMHSHAYWQSSILHVHLPLGKPVCRLQPQKSPRLCSWCHIASALTQRLHLEASVAMGYFCEAMLRICCSCTKEEFHLRLHSLLAELLPE